MYKLETYRFRNSMEYEYKYMGKYGAKGEKRQKKKKATPEQIKKQNQLNREKKQRRVIKANFVPNDLWCTLKYPEGTRKTVHEIQTDFQRFLKEARACYKKLGIPFKWVSRMEIGEKGGIHIHILLNRIAKEDTDVMIQKLWKHGRVNFESIYELGGYRKLAEYIVKQPNEEEWEQLTLFAHKEQKKLIKCSSSRNLVRPVPEKETCRRWTVRRILEEGPKPSKGFYIDKESVISGVNPYTGMSYLYYTEVRIKEETWINIK